jgi:hypothetical protein
MQLSDKPNPIGTINSPAIQGKPYCGIIAIPKFAKHSVAVVKDVVEMYWMVATHFITCIRFKRAGYRSEAIRFRHDVRMKSFAWNIINDGNKTRKD